MKNRIIVFVFIFLALVFGVFVYQNRGASFPSEKNVLSAQKDAEQQEQTQAITGIPVRLIIESIGVDASIESVGLDKDGNMDVPKHVANVAWYNLGYAPGEKGNTVIAGHLDTESGAPAVFYDLERLNRGDVIRVEDKNGNMFRYIVTGSAKYPYDKFPLEEIFGSSDKNRLNLITCEGEYNTAKKIYSHRTVVFADLVTINN